ARVAGRRPELLRLLHDAVPRTEDVTARRRLLAIRRAVGRADAPYDESAHGIEAGPESAHPLVAAPESPPRPLVAAPESPPRLRGVAPEAVRLPGVAPVLARLLGAVPELVHPLTAVPELARLLAADMSDRRELVRLRAAFAQAHAQELDRQREALWRLTHEPRFAKALVLAHPAVAARWAAAPCTAPADKRRRRVEDTVLRYVL
ncbi:hypothetical protein, partial [Streptomyces sp. SID3343]|uniref:hypothetical protein n=1 Tax=Streptomyces sp. SID3343 TaxID=2690260 RepID=UPI0013BF2EF0